MYDLDVIIPVKNEAETLEELVKRVDISLTSAHISFQLIFIDDHSTDQTIPLLEKLSRKYPIKIFQKKGRPGKAFSILEAFPHTNAEWLVMLDADLQYPPEAIPEMFAKRQTYGIVVGERKIYKSTWFRRIASRVNAFIFGKLLFGLNTDVQSGLKLFHREVLEHLDLDKISSWSIDIPLLFTAVELGYRIGSVSITFEKRSKGESKIRFFSVVWDIARGALLLKFRHKSVYYLKPQKNHPMLGAGLVYQRRRFITHTTLPHGNSALETFKFWQKATIFFLIGLTVGGLLTNALATAIIVTGILSAVYFIDVLFNLFLVLRSLHAPPELIVTAEDLATLDEKNLPVYSILCPLYREAHVVPQFIEALLQLDYPREKLDVLLLLEADDQETISIVSQMKLPEFVRVVVVPDSQPKTKPKACNYGLHHVRGEYMVIYDAEDVPERLQLKKSLFAFQHVPKNVVCLQAKLNYYNPHHNLLTRLFTAEYSLWFDVILTGLQSLNTSIPLGGTSNHFRTKDLLAMAGWDPFNVTEDCDLGIRLFKSGYQTAVIDSITLEEANSNVKNWLRQRSRWIKGYLQTYFVHMRQPIAFTRQKGIHALIFQLVVGGKIAFMLINPFLWLLTISYFALYSLVGPQIEAVYPPIVFYMAVVSLVFGNFLCLYYYMIGCAKRGHWTVIKYVFLVPFYWLLVSVAAVIALVQLIVNPHYWEKTHHGLHLKPIESKPTEVTAHQSVSRPVMTPAWSMMKGSTALVLASMVANFFNYLYNTYLWRVVSVEEFGLISLMGSFLSLSQIPLSSFSRAITHQSAYLFGKHNERIKSVWVALRGQVFVPSLVLIALWLGASPVLAHFFRVSSLVPFMLFTPIWAVGLYGAVDAGYLSGNLFFGAVAILTMVDVVGKFAITVLLVTFGLHQYVYAALSASGLLSFLIGWVIIRRTKKETVTLRKEQLTHLSKRFFVSSVLSKLSGIAFLSFDMLLAKHYLTPTQAGNYALLSMIGKMVYFLGSLFTQFVIPVISREEGAGRNPKNIFKVILLCTSFSVFVGFVGLGLLGQYTVPLLWPKSTAILYLLPGYTLAMACFALSQAIVSYHQSRRQYLFSVVNALLVVGVLGAVTQLHSSIEQINLVISLGSIFSFVSIAFLHVLYPRLAPMLGNFNDLLDLIFPRTKFLYQKNGHLRILIFNWRDTKHIWSGGAELYIHELAKRWALAGHRVTVFCGNDGQNPRNQVVDGVQIVRRGGFYMVYFWAFLYYVLRFRNNFDVVIDSENGIPFFSKVYVRVPVFLLIHHVHQMVFRNHLAFPLAQIAMFMESRVMPLVYRTAPIITVSESSKQEIRQLGFKDLENIHVIYPGIDLEKFVTMQKTKHPSFLYLGRLRPYKHVDVAIRAFAKVLPKHPQAMLTIAGEGNSSRGLQELVTKLNLAKSVVFTGKVTEEEKVRLLSTSWCMIQPSSIEGWGITVVESNACGTPVLASNVNGLRDSVIHQKTGILIPPKNVSAFASAMANIITNTQLRHQLSKDAREWSQTFNWDESAQKFLELLQENTIRTTQPKFMPTWAFKGTNL